MTNVKKFPLLLTGLLTLATVGAAGTTTAHASSAVNSYIASQKITPAKVTSNVWSGFPKNAYRHGVGKPEGVVVHETANPNSTIYNEIAYMKANYNNAFVHSFVDATHIIDIANTNYLAWGVGFPGNARFVQFEQVEVHSKSAFAHEVSNAAWYTAYLLHQYGLKPNRADYDGKGTVWSHRAVAKYLGGSDHTDPVGYYSTTGKKYFGQGYTMVQFYQLVSSYYNSDFSSASASSTSSATAATSVDKVTYTKQSTTGTLSSNYTKYRLYNHVKNAYTNMKKYSWSSVGASVGKKIYINNKGVKDKQGTTWYRFTFSTAAGAKQYWAYSGAVNVDATATTASSATASSSSATK
ncbi:N-acetylmuramoyl-L-alanine amidase family 2 protein [Secundilactobacillus odoratitofui DSM 19909 = JCM 15043]|uniref:N-acetylmuramoyl-L-alanine amidase family 2 protein n=1 Tax=Secundilactobacillus odoratitofui DSM 19909 = JCM 15043 TaxID=1423776 RepID=A0A0R1LM60_9LACO|nr:N-acetylmuramoyl-L-alanine amidase family 2 protein [Secundilactobacillus odoratitofui DSM 19909 = JCM 15043]